MAPAPLTLLSFAILNSPKPLIGHRRRAIEPHRWIPQHLSALKITVQQDGKVLGPKNVTFSFSTAEERDRKRDMLKKIEILLLTLQCPVVDQPGFYSAAWTIISSLSPTPWINRGPAPIGFVNTHVLHAFVGLVDCMIGPHLQLISRSAHTSQSFARTLKYRNQTIWLVPDLCIIVTPKHGDSISIPVFYPELHRRTRSPLAPEIAFILACAQRRFRVPALKQDESVRVVVLRVKMKEVFFVCAVVPRSYLESVEQTGTPDAGLKVKTSPKWDLKTGKGRLGFFVGLKQVAESMSPRVNKVIQAKRKSEDIS